MLRVDDGGNGGGSDRSADVRVGAGIGMDEGSGVLEVLAAVEDEVVSMLALVV